MLKDLPVFVIFTKIDLFENKIENIKFSNYFKNKFDEKYDKNPKKIFEFIKNLFFENVNKDKEKKVYFDYFNLIDNEDGKFCVEFIFKNYLKDFLKIDSMNENLFNIDKNKIYLKRKNYLEGKRFNKTEKKLFRINLKNNLFNKKGKFKDIFLNFYEFK
jgi:hypothetical protein